MRGSGDKKGLCKTGSVGRVRRTLDQKIRPQDRGGANTDARFCGTVGGAEARQDYS
jgi:hypothetical protein